MKNLLSLTVCAAALAVATGGAQAADAANAFGQRFIDLIDTEFQDGVASNWAINNSTLDGSVTIDQINIATSTTSSFDDTVTEQIERTFRSDGSLATRQDTTTTVDQSTTTSGQVIAKVNLGEISTAVVGAINDGEIRIGQRGNASSESFSESLVLTDVVWAEGVASEAAYTENTGYADYSADFYAEGSGTFSGAASGATSAYGPANDYFTMNFAYNDSFLDGSVNMTGNGMSAETVATSVAGAVNTGIIENGICGGACGVGTDSGS